MEIEQEQPPTESGKPPAHWPASGNLSVEGLSARYSLDGPEVLHGVTFSCQSGEKIGVGAFPSVFYRQDGLICSSSWAYWFWKKLSDAEVFLTYLLR